MVTGTGVARKGLCTKSPNVILVPGKALILVEALIRSGLVAAGRLVIGSDWAGAEHITPFPRLMPVLTRAQTLGNIFLDPGRGLTAGNEDLKVIFA